MEILQEFVESGERRALRNWKKNEMGILGNDQEDMKRGFWGRHIPIPHFQVSTPGRNIFFRS